MPPPDTQLYRLRLSNRAQSEVVGVVILVGVIVTLSLTVSLVVLGNVSDQASDDPLVDLNATLNASGITLTHGGGDTLDATDVTVILRNDSSEERYALDTFTESTGSDPDRFEPGESWARSQPFSTGVVRVLVVHRPSNAVVYDEAVEVN